MVSHDVEVAAAFLDREFRHAGVEDLRSNRKYCTRRRYDRETKRGTGSSTLGEVGKALDLWRHVQSPIDAQDKDAMTTLLVATHFWVVDNHSKARPSSSPARRRLISNKTFKAALNVLVGLSGVAMLIKAVLPALIGLVAILAFLYWLSPGAFVFMLFLLPTSVWFMWWATRRAEEIDREESGQ